MTNDPRRPGPRQTHTQWFETVRRLAAFYGRRLPPERETWEAWHRGASAVRFALELPVIERSR